MRVLVVDDDEITLELLGSMLRKRGHAVDTATDGEEALAILGRGEHRIVVCDWEMPGCSGPELCATIRATDFGSYIYTILLTARTHFSDAIAGLNAGADDFIVKPVDPDQLDARVRIAERILSTQSHDATIFALAKLAESRDVGSGGHLERVRAYSRILAEQIARRPEFAGEIGPGYAQLIFQASPLHDVGKSGIPDGVLLKAGRLTPEEHEVMKAHTVIGAQTLQAALDDQPQAGFLRMARDVALTHHERWDGAGYPRGLKERQIPLCGRIVALADVYDALTSWRVYRPAFDPATARAMILKEAGTHFAPEVVEAFLACEPQFFEVRERYPDPPQATSLAA